MTYKSPGLAKLTNLFFRADELASLPELDGQVAEAERAIDAAAHEKIQVILMARDVAGTRCETLVRYLKANDVEDPEFEA